MLLPCSDMLILSTRFSLYHPKRRKHHDHWTLINRSIPEGGTHHGSLETSPRAACFVDVATTRRSFGPLTNLITSSTKRKEHKQYVLQLCNVLMEFSLEYQPYSGTKPLANFGW